MKASYYFLFAALFFLSCEDVIEVDAPAEAPRLIVDAILRLDTNETVTTSIIKVGLSSSFFDSNEAADVDQIIIRNSDYESSGPSDQSFIIFTEIAPGIFQGSKNTSFFTSGNLELTIDYGEERYYARTNFVPSAPIDSLEQGDDTLFTGEETEIIVSFTDNPNRSDFYIFDFDFDEFLVSEDEFYQGQTFQFSYFYDDEIEVGRTLEISILGADESFYNYMNQLIVQSGGDQGPFQTPAATVRGNIINITGIDDIGVIESVEQTNNFALGYFAVVEEFKASITIE